MKRRRRKSPTAASNARGRPSRSGRPEASSWRAGRPDARRSPRAREASASAKPTSFAEWKRFSRSFSRQCRITRSRAGETLAPEADKLRRLFLQDRRHRVGGRVPSERLLARQELVEHRSEREDVRAVIERKSAHLFGRHVADGSHHRAGLRQARGRRGARLLDRGGRLDPLGQAEVEDLDVAVPARRRRSRASGRGGRRPSRARRRGPGRSAARTRRPASGRRSPASSFERSVSPSSSSMTA